MPGFLMFFRAGLSSACPFCLEAWNFLLYVPHPASLFVSWLAMYSGLIGVLPARKGTKLSSNNPPLPLPRASWLFGHGCRAVPRVANHCHVRHVLASAISAPAPTARAIAAVTRAPASRTSTPSTTASSPSSRRRRAAHAPAAPAVTGAPSGTPAARRITPVPAP